MESVGQDKKDLFDHIELTVMTNRELQPIPTSDVVMALERTHPLLVADSYTNAFSILGFFGYVSITCS